METMTSDNMGNFVTTRESTIISHGEFLDGSVGHNSCAMIFPRQMCK